MRAVEDVVEEREDLVVVVEAGVLALNVPAAAAAAALNDRVHHQEEDPSSHNPEVRIPDHNNDQRHVRHSHSNQRHARQSSRLLANRHLLNVSQQAEVVVAHCPRQRPAP